MKAGTVQAIATSELGLVSLHISSTIEEQKAKIVKKMANTLSSCSFLCYPFLSELRFLPAPAEFRFTPREDREHQLEALLYSEEARGADKGDE